MSFRAAFVRAKKLATEFFLSRRVLLTGKPHPQAKPQDGSPLVRDAARPRAFIRAETAQANRLQRVVGFRPTNSIPSLAAQLRRSTVLRLIGARYALSGRGGGGRGMRSGASGTHLPIYAFLGLTIAAGERSLLNENDAVNENEKIRRLPLETCCDIVRDVFQSQGSPDHLPTQGEFPSDTSSYDISDQLLGKGTSASIYAARLRQLPQTKNVVMDTASDDEDDGQDDVVSFEGSEEAWELVTDGEETSDSSFAEVSFGAGDDASVASRRHLLKEDAEDGYDLALKMPFNYDIDSDATAIAKAFERECLPLWPSLGSGSFGNSRWENGHRSKKKDQRFLPRHANIVEIYHAFVALTVAHNLEEARTCFPAALPTRLHVDGMGRNQTMFIVMKRYNMTLAEYNQSIGCQSQHIAMVIIAQLLEGVAHLVHHGIAHRDLKSNNILIELTEGSPHVVIADFGCCLADNALGLHLPFTSKYVDIGGNSALMAPEVKSAIPGPGATIDYTKSDVWAIGAISYEILGLPNPFYQRDGTAGLDSALYNDTDLSRLPDNTASGIAEVIGLLLRKDPAERPAARVAANMLHLLLWQLPVLTVASWEGTSLIPATLSLQQHLATWLLCLSAGLLCRRSQRGQKPWLDATEYQLCLNFVSCVTPNDLAKAATHLGH